MFILAADPEEHWSKCWTWFPSRSTICKREFGPEFEDVGRKACGFLGLGMQINCRRSCKYSYRVLSCILLCM